LPWNPDWSEFDHDPTLDIFRDSAAEISDGRTTGVVAFRVSVWSSRMSGFLWWTKWTRAREYVAWLETVWPDAREAPDPEKALTSDGDAYPPSEWLDDVRDGSYRLTLPVGPDGVAEERMLTVRWLSRDELEAAKRDWGWGLA
jgi:hypothetical protein